MSGYIIGGGGGTSEVVLTGRVYPEVLLRHLVYVKVVAKGDGREEGFQNGGYFSTSLKRKRIND